MIKSHILERLADKNAFFKATIKALKHRIETEDIPTTNDFIEAEPVYKYWELLKNYFIRVVKGV